MKVSSIAHLHRAFLLWLAVLAALPIAFTPVSGGTCMPPPAGLVGWWKGEGNITDGVNGDNGTVVSGAVTYAPAEVGQGFNFDGGANRITVPDAPQLNFGANQDFSIEAWIQPDVAVTDYGVMSIVDKRIASGSTDSPNGYEFSTSNGHVDCRFGSVSFISAGPDLRDGLFHHVALTVSRNSTNGGKLFADGVVVLTFDPTALNGSLINSEPLRIGNHADASLNCFFKGIIDEVSLYNRALATNEITAIYNAGSAGKCLITLPGCQIYSNFNSIAGLSLVGNAAVTNGVLRLTPAVVGQTGDAWLSAKQPCAGGFDTTFHFSISTLGNDLGNEPGGDGFTFAIQNLGPTNLSWAMGDTNQFVAVFFNTFWNWPGCTCPDVSDNSVGIVVNQTYIAQTDLNPLGMNMSDGTIHQAHVSFDGTGITVWVDGTMVLTNVTLPGLAPGVDASGQGWVGFSAGTGDAFENHDIVDWSFCVNGSTPSPSGVPVISSFTPANGFSGNGVDHFRCQFQRNSFGEHRLFRRGTGECSGCNANQLDGGGSNGCDVCANHCHGEWIDGVFP